jgi:hypothetical protein
MSVRRKLAFAQRILLALSAHRGMTDRPAKTAQRVPNAPDMNVLDLIVLDLIEQSARRDLADQPVMTVPSVPSADPAMIVLLVPSAANVTSVAHLPVGTAHALITLTKRLVTATTARAGENVLALTGMIVRRVATTGMSAPHAGATEMTDRFVRPDPSALSVLVLTAQTARRDATTVTRDPHEAQIDSTARHAGMIVPTAPSVETPRSTLTSRTNPRSLRTTTSCSNASRRRPRWPSTSRA